MPAVDRVLEIERTLIRAERERRVPLDARSASRHHRPLHVVAEPSPEDLLRPPIRIVRVDRPLVSRHRCPVARANAIQISRRVVLLDRQRPRGTPRQVVERYRVPRHRPGELVPHSSIWALRRRVQDAQLLALRASRLEQLRDRARREAAASMFGSRDHTPDPAHPELPPAEPLTEVARRGRRDDAVALEHAPHLLHRQPRGAFGHRRRAEVERDAHQPDDLLAVLVARRDELGGHRTNAHPHGIAPHFGQPFAYRAAASSRSTPARFASEPNHASTSPNSCTRSPSPRNARATSPTSSVNHRNVPSTPALRIALDVGTPQDVLERCDLHQGASLSSVELGLGVASSRDPGSPRCRDRGWRTPGRSRLAARARAAGCTRPVA